MANFAVGTFTKRTTTGTDSVTGLGFQPKFVMCWSSWAPTDLTTNTGLRYGMGFASGTAAADHGAWAVISADASANSSAGRRHDQCLILRCDTAGGVLSRATLQSFDAGGFTVNWDTNAGSSELIHYLAIGGSDFSAKVVKYLQTTGTGGASRAVTGAGFAPTAAMALTTGATAAPPAAAASVQVGFGCATNDGTAFSIAMTSVDLQATMATRRSWRNDAIVHKLTTGSDSEGYRMTVSTWDSDGFTLAQTETSDTADDHVYFAFFAGIESYISAPTKPTGAAPQTTVLTPGFKPSCVILASDGQAGGSNGTVVAHSRFMVGASDGTNHASSFVRDIDNIATSQTDSWPSNTKSHLINNDTDDTLETYGTTALSATQVTLTHNPNSSEATQLFALVLGTVNSAPYFSAGPTVSYPNGISTNQGSTPWTLSFTPADAEQQGSNELTYEVRTASGGGGGILANGNCTHGGGVAPTFAFTTTAVGVVSVWVRLGDGWTFYEQSVNVNRTAGPMLPLPQQQSVRALMARSYD